MPEAPYMVRAGALPGQLVIVLQDGAIQGVCRKVVEDPFLGRVLGYAFEDDEWYEGPKFLPQAAVVGFGENALLLENRRDILELHQAAEIRLILKQRESLIEKHVMTEAGKYLGEIFDYAFTPEGKITTYFLHRYLAGESASYTLPADRTVRVGKNLVLVTDAALALTDLRPERGDRPERAMVTFAAPTHKGLNTLKRNVGGEPGVERPAATIKTANPGGESVGDRFNQRQFAYLLGRRCEREIRGDQGELIVARGQLIDEAAIRQAQSLGKFMELAISSRTGATLAGQPAERGAA
ncbi:MAG: hypothetical protein ABI743_05015 [bacterium]